MIKNWEDTRRWEIKKIGLLNYWWYDEEEFEFCDGRMILRGTNGSGKSVTMQSFIPLLLDGNKSPERLDPFNTKARKIEDYVLGYGDNVKDENTSYLYMEFQKKNTEEYITVGMGLRGKKNNGVSFWGFIITDGRRVGKDIFLYKELDNKIPLTKMELKNRIGEGGQVVDTQKEYATLVNNHIFGFKSMEEYQEYIKLLIEIRMPKLSKGEFKPSVITEIMSNSLRALSDAELQSVSESIENMNKTKEQLENMKVGLKSIENICIYFDKYNKYVLYNKAKKYNQIKKVYNKKQELYKNLEKEFKINNENLEKLQKEKQDVENKIEIYNYKKSELEKSEFWKNKEEQEQIKQDIIELEKEFEKRTNIKSEKQKNILNKEKEKREVEDELEGYNKEFNNIKLNMETLAKAIEYDEYFFEIDEIDVSKKHKYDMFKNNTQKYIEQIEKGKKSLEKEAGIRNDYENAMKQRDEQSDKKVKQDEVVNKCRQDFEQEKDAFVEMVYNWNNINKEIKLEKESLEYISHKVNCYGEGSEYDDIFMYIREAINKVNGQILNKKAILSAQKVEIENRINKIKEEIEEWKNKKDPEPIKTKWVAENRKHLKEKGIPYIELYKVVDFKGHLTDDEKNIIESTLMDMGLLDAIIIPNNYQDKALNMEEQFVDKYLFASSTITNGQNLGDFLDVSISDDLFISRQFVEDILKSIVWNKCDNTQTYITEKGRYKTGLIKGVASKQEVAKYVGANARNKYRQNKILDLNKNLDEEKKMCQSLQDEIDTLDNRLSDVNVEKEKFPKKDMLEQKYNELRKNVNIIQSMIDRLKDLEIEVASKAEILKQATEARELATQNIRFAKRLDVFSENLEFAKQFKEQIIYMEKAHENILNKQDKVLSLKEIINDMEFDISELIYEINKIEANIDTLKGKLESINEILTSNLDLEKQMEECLKQIRELPQNKEKMVIQISSIKTKNERLEKDKVDIIQELEQSKKETDLSKNILYQELQLKYVIKDFEENDKISKDIVEDYNFFEKDGKDLNAYYETMIDKFKNNMEHLQEYNISANRIFEKEIDMNENLRELQKTRVRTDFKCIVNGKVLNIYQLRNYVKEMILETQNLIEDEDKTLFEDILIGAVGNTIRQRIYDAKDWVEAMNKLMRTLNTSSGLSFSLNWRSKHALDEGEVDTKEIVKILEIDHNLLKQEDIKKFATHFRTKFMKAEKSYKEKGNIIPFYVIIKEELDYRKWFEFQFMFKKTNEQYRELTNNAFYKLSGGEKAMAMYVPLFASVCAKYDSADKEAPHIIAIDEAFAGVDDNNIRDMFRILTELKLEYLINSQVLWGEYDTVPSLAISELVTDANEKIVTVIRYKWNGKKRIMI